MRSSDKETSPTRIDRILGILENNLIIIQEQNSIVNSLNDRVKQLEELIVVQTNIMKIQTDINKEQEKKLTILNDNILKCIEKI